MNNSGQPINPQDYTILIVDDEDDLREILGLSFRSAGFKTLEAVNGKKAFEIIKGEKVDLVVSDVQMPGGNGVELLDNIRQRHDELPVLLFLTGFSDISVEDAYNRGAEALLSKPFDFKALLKTVYQALGSKEEKWGHRPWRGETALPVKFKCNQSDTTQEGKVINLGQGGLFVAIEGSLPRVNDRVDFRLEVTEGRFILVEAQGVVKWLRDASKGAYPSGFGIEFTALSSTSKCQIIELINYLKTRPCLSRT